MTSFHGDDLRDPQPPIPGAAERAAVATRAGELVRRRRFAQATGGVVAIAAIAVVVAALTAAGPGTRTDHPPVAAADSPSGDAGVESPPPTTTAPPAPEPAPTTVAPAAPVASDSSQGTPDANAGQAPARTVTAFGHVTGIPAGTTITVRFIGAGTGFSAIVQPSGDFVIRGLPPGTYTESWESTNGAVGQVGAADLTRSNDASFSIIS